MPREASLSIAIIGGILFIGLVICIVFLFIANKVHRNMFGNRYTSDSRISYYTKEQFGLGFRELSVPIKKGEFLRGGEYSYPNAKEDILFVYAHGMWSGVAAYLQDIEFIARQGYSVIALNHEGTDSSDGKNIRGLANSLRCLDKTISYLESCPEYKNKKIYVAGHSWGGFAVTNIVRYHPEIQGVLAMSPFLDIPSCMRGMVERKQRFIIPFFQWIDFMKCGRYSYSKADKAFKGFMGNVVILHSENDTMVKYEYNTGRLVNKYPNVMVKTVKDKGHQPHYTYAALQALGEFEAKMRACSSKEEQTEYMKTVNFNALGALDENLFKELLDCLMK